MATKELTVYVVEATSLEAIRRAPPSALSLDRRFDQMSDETKPKPTELARFFDRSEATRFSDSLHPTWFRPAIREQCESLNAQHVAHGGLVGK